MCVHLMNEYCSEWRGDEWHGSRRASQAQNIEANEVAMDGSKREANALNIVANGVAMNGSKRA